jgi:hypothetical protein
MTINPESLSEFTYLRRPPGRRYLSPVAERRKRRESPTRGTAPSSADITKLDRMEPSEEAKAHTPSDVDAMGQDKRRKVVGHSYGPSRRSQLKFFGAVAAIVIVVVADLALALAVFDKPPGDYANEAPWSRADAEQIPTRDPSTPCGEPGNPYPPEESSPCGPGGIRAQAGAETGPGSGAAGAPSSDRTE